MTNVRVKPISELEVKSEVSASDKILILDSDTDEARLADKAELKGDKGDPGDPGTPGAAATITVGTTTTGAAGTSASVTNSGTSSAAVLNFTIPKGDKGDTGAKGADGRNGVDGQDGADGNGIASITSSKAGKVTTVTITETNGDSESFQISDGADGEGSGDVIGPSSSTNGDIVLFDGTTGKLIKDSGKTLNDLGSSWGNITGDIGDQTDLQDALDGKQDTLTAGTDLEIITQAGRNLPAGYTELEYLQSSGTQWIDTGVVGNVSSTRTLKSDVGVRYDTAPTADTCLLGSRTGNVRAYMVYCYMGWCLGYGAQYRWAGNITAETKYFVTTEYKENSQTFDANGIRTMSYTDNMPFTTDLNMYLFAINEGGVAKRFQSAKVYYAKIYVNDVLESDLVPCKRDSDDAIGMYDLVSNTFKANSGSGTFTAGPVVQPGTVINFTNDTGYLTSSTGVTSFNGNHGAITYTAPVTSVNTQTGAVVLDADDISDSTTTNKFVTATDKTTWGNKQDALTLPATPTQGNLVTRGANNKSLVDGGAIPTGVPSGGTDGQVLSKVSGSVAWATPSGGDVVVSSQSGNILTTGMKIRAGLETDYGNLGTYDSNTLYLTIE